MSLDVPILNAVATLNQALRNGEDPTKQAYAVELLGDLLATLSAFDAKLFARIALRQISEEERPASVNEVTASMLQLLHDDSKVFRAVFWLLRLIQPRWVLGGEFPGDAPPLAEVAPHVLAAIDGNAIDANGYSAIIIGRYGPEAEGLLPDLLDRLRKHRTDCSRAPGLTWSVYMIGGLRPTIRDLMIEIVTLKDSCPHSKKLAAQILSMNQVAY